MDTNLTQKVDEATNKSIKSVAQFYQADRTSINLFAPNPKNVSKSVPNPPDSGGIKARQ